MPRLDIERQQQLEPKRMELAIERLKSLGIEVVYQDTSQVKFEHKGAIVSFFPYSGWHTGKSITDGRGADKLFSQLKK